MTKENPWVFYPAKDIKHPDYQVAFLMSPHISYPTKIGNSIATLVDTIATKINYQTIVFCTNNNHEALDSWKGNYGLAVNQNKMKKHFLERFWLGRGILNNLVSPLPTAWRKYARQCADVCIMLGVKVLIIEDVADFGWLVRKLRKHGIKVVLHQHAYTQRNYKKWLWKRIERQLDRLIFVSQKTKQLTEELHGKLKASTEIVYNGVDLELYDPKKSPSFRTINKGELGFDSHQTIIGYIGRLSASKGIFELIEAYRNLGRKDIGFIIVGGLDAKERARHSHDFHMSLKSLQGSGFSVRYFENIEQNQIPDFYAMLDYVVIPSHNYYEGLPKVVTEALAMGVPVIASDRGGTWELVEESKTGWLIENPVGVVTIMEALEKALKTSPSELAKMQEYNLIHDRPKMDQKIMVEKFSDLISELIGEPH